MCQNFCLEGTFPPTVVDVAKLDVDLLCDIRRLDVICFVLPQCTRLTENDKDGHNFDHQNCSLRGKSNRKLKIAGLQFMNSKPNFRIQGMRRRRKMAVKERMKRKVDKVDVTQLLLDIIVESIFNL